MKQIRKMMMAAVCCLCCVTEAGAQQECDLPVAVVTDGVGDGMPEPARQVLENALTRLAVSSGMTTDLRFTDFVLTARVDVLDKHVIAGPPPQVCHSLGLTLYVVNAATQTKFASAYIELSGVGVNETKSMTDALRRIGDGNAKVRQMLKDGREKIVAWYDANWQTVLKEAGRKATLQELEEAVALAMSVPSCSQGYEAALALGLDLYGRYSDRLNLALLNRARAVWGSGQDRQAALEAGSLLSRIDPEAACYGDAAGLMAEIRAQLRSDIDFEVREKYADGVELERTRIDALKAIGVAYGKGQQPVTTNLSWLR